MSTLTQKQPKNKANLVYNLNPMKPRLRTRWNLTPREGPVLLAAFARLRAEPDLILIDGHGRAHPRLFGIASHIGVLFDKPAIGCAKSLLVGDYAEPAARAGSASPLLFRGERVGMVLRSRQNVQP